MAYGLIGYWVHPVAWEWQDVHDWSEKQVCLCVGIGRQNGRLQWHISPHSLGGNIAIHNERMLGCSFLFKNVGILLSVYTPALQQWIHSDRLIESGFLETKEILNSSLLVVCGCVRPLYVEGWHQCIGFLPLEL